MMLLSKRGYNIYTFNKIYFNMKTKKTINEPKIMDMAEIKSFLIYCRDGGDFYAYENHPWNRYLKYNNNKGKHYLKLASQYIRKFLSTDKHFQNNIIEAVKNGKTFDTKSLNRLIALLDKNTYLGKRYINLMQLRRYFTYSQGSIFWINLIRINIIKLINLYLLI